ncbi:MAG: hypothetical protein KDK12_01150 [Rhodobacteraceae bacterium]|nr:hypothetical protein [Paracoccaceae bacterium]
MRLKKPILAFAALVALAAPAHAACYAEYRASRQNPVQLAYGVAQIPGGSCSAQAASQYLQSRLSRSGWTLQNVLSTVTSNSAPANSGYTGGHYLAY